jgi:hypothetical protein
MMHRFKNKTMANPATPETAQRHLSKGRWNGLLLSLSVWEAG